MKIPSNLLTSMLLVAAVAATTGCNPSTTATTAGAETPAPTLQTPDTATAHVPTADPDTVQGPDPDAIPDHYNCPACGMG